MHKKIKEINKELENQAEVDLSIDQIYQSSHGIGATTARILANELGDMTPFLSGIKKGI